MYLTPDIRISVCLIPVWLLISLQAICCEESARRWWR
jgi:hypothetical protein